jgi:signal transduction histidine kinase
LTLQGKPFRILNRVLDGAIGLAVKNYADERALESQHRREDYLAFVAHDLRTPLTAIALASSVLERTIPPQSVGTAQAQMFKSLRRNVQNLDGLVAKVIDENSTLVPEHDVKPERRAFDLWPLVESLVQDLGPVASAAHTRLVNQVPDDLVVYADAGLLKRVFQNLVQNAINYTPHGEVVIGATQGGAGGTIECFVRDNGAGIPKERLDKVFDKAVTDPEKIGGSGLGLAIVKTFIEAHGGKVSVESKEGQGSTFRFTLPPMQSESTAKASLAT